MIFAIKISVLFILLIRKSSKDKSCLVWISIFFDKKGQKIARTYILIIEVRCDIF